MTGIRCPSCGNDQVPEFFQPSGLALCTACGRLLRRDRSALRSIEKAPEALEDFAQRYLTVESAAQAVLDDAKTFIAQHGGIDERQLTEIATAHGLASLDVLEVLMLIEEDLGVTVGAANTRAHGSDEETGS